MTLDEFKQTIADDNLPAGIDVPLQALWYDARGNWEKAHELAQSIDSPDGAWVHAYLHRREGEMSNASYWYTRAGKQPSNLSLEAEWTKMAIELLCRT
jgi:hypothetical protein